MRYQNFPEQIHITIVNEIFNVHKFPKTKMATYERTPLRAK